MIAYCWGCMRSLDESEMRRRGGVLLCRRCHAIRLQQRHLEGLYIPSLKTGVFRPSLPVEG